MKRVTGVAKLVYIGLLFVVALGLLAAAAAAHSAVPLFFLWLPLLGVPWVLVRPEPADPPQATADGGEERGPDSEG